MGDAPHEVHLTPAEALILNSLIGRPLDRVSAEDRQAPYVSASVYSESREIILAIEEVFTPTPEIPGAHIHRPKVYEGPVAMYQLHSPSRENLLATELRILGESLGTITQILVLTTAVSFDGPHAVGPVQVLDDVVLPEGTAWGPVLTHPNEGARPTPPVAMADLGILIKTDSGHTAIFNTEGIGFIHLWVTVDGPVAGALAGVVEEISISERLR